MDLTQAIINKIKSMIADKSEIAIGDQKAQASVNSLQALHDWILTEKEKLEKKLAEKKERAQEYMVSGLVHYLDKTMRAPVTRGFTDVVEADNEEDAKKQYRAKVEKIVASEPQEDKEFSRITIEKVTKLGEEN